MDKIIEIKNLSKSFGDKKVLEDINLYIRRGEFITLLGPSGCGKTTLLRMIAGFLQPDEGSILMEGKELAGVPPHERPLNTVFQRYALFPHLDVYDNIQESTRGGNREARPPGPQARRDVRLRGPRRGDPLRRSAAAYRHRPRHREPAEGAPPGRAPRRPGPQDAQASRCERTCRSS